MQKGPGLPLSTTLGPCWFVLSHTYLLCGVKELEMQQRTLGGGLSGTWYPKVRLSPLHLGFLFTASRRTVCKNHPRWSVPFPAALPVTSALCSRIPPPHPSSSIYRAMAVRMNVPFPKLNVVVSGVKPSRVFPCSGLGVLGSASHEC